MESFSWLSFPCFSLTLIKLDSIKYVMLFVYPFVNAVVSTVCHLHFNDMYDREVIVKPIMLLVRWNQYIYTYTCIYIYIYIHIYVYINIHKYIYTYVNTYICIYIYIYICIYFYIYIYIYIYIHVLINLILLGFAIFFKYPKTNICFFHYSWQD